MNTPEQIAVVKAIIKIKKRILHSSEPDVIADLLMQAVDLAAVVPANANNNTLDRTKSKAWNIIALKRMIKAIKEKNFESTDTLYAEVSVVLLRLSMAFVQGELSDVNKILSQSFLKKGVSPAKKEYVLRHNDDE